MEERLGTYREPGKALLMLNSVSRSRCSFTPLSTRSWSGPKARGKPLLFKDIEGSPETDAGCPDIKRVTASFIVLTRWIVLSTPRVWIDLLMKAVQYVMYLSASSTLRNQVFKKIINLLII